MALDHWVVISDDDLRLIEDGPETDDLGFASNAELWAWIVDVQDAILDGLETA